MSHTYKITTDKRIDIAEFVDELRSSRRPTYYIDKSPTYHIFDHGQSTRGVEVTEINEGYEIRMTFLSNVADYLLCNQIVYILCSKLQGTLANEYGTEFYIGTLFYDGNIQERIDEEVSTLFSLLNDNRKIEIFGPIREFTFGEKIRKKVLALQGDKYGIAYKLSNIILSCQYPPENFIPFSNFLRVSSENDESYYIQVLTNSKDMVIEKVKQYAITTEEGESIYLIPEQLFTILPNEWKLVDDCTILAKQLNSADWLKFIEAAKALSAIS